MALPRSLAVISLTLAFTLASPASAAPLSLDELMKLEAEGVGEPVLLSIARNQGVSGPLTAEQILAMNREGWSDELMSAVVEAAAKARTGSPAPVDQPAEGVLYEERDGAVVARLRGSPEQRSNWAGSEAPPSAGAPPQVVVVQAPAANPVVVSAPAQAPAPARRDDVGFPLGAVHGYHGSTVFLPARFGGSRPSAFGRTVTSTGGGGVPYYGVPYAAPLPTYGYGGPVLTAPSRGQTTLIRTSRGTRRIPN